MLHNEHEPHQLREHPMEGILAQEEILKAERDRLKIKLDEEEVGLFL